MANLDFRWCLAGDFFFKSIRLYFYVMSQDISVALSFFSLFSLSLIIFDTISTDGV